MFCKALIYQPQKSPNSPGLTKAIPSVCKQVRVEKEMNMWCKILTRCFDCPPLLRNTTPTMFSSLLLFVITKSNYSYPAGGQTLTQLYLRAHSWWLESLVCSWIITNSVKTTRWTSNNQTKRCITCVLNFRSFRELARTVSKEWTGATWYVTQQQNMRHSND